MEPNKLESLLKMFLDKTYSETKDRGHNYVICGSMATYLQGCNIQPNDIDILAMEPDGVSFVAGLMKEYEVESSPSQAVDDWLSSSNEPVFTDLSDDKGEQWYMARWSIDQIKVEIAHIVSEKAMKSSAEKRCIWENGPGMYPYIKSVEFHGYELHVIPLEIQLSTNMFRGLNERVSKILQTLQTKGYDKELLEKALTPEQFSTVTAQLDK
ncbi:MAG: hypothetical protein GF411_10650 [Candidatus Lokiarchaeota archaeon]|nr:hypothetical protein [Candidatus Lokiarchaeota archaeon]